MPIAVTRTPYHVLIVRSNKLRKSPRRSHQAVRDLHFNQSVIAVPQSKTNDVPGRGLDKAGQSAGPASAFYMCGCWAQTPHYCKAAQFPYLTRLSGKACYGNITRLV